MPGYCCWRQSNSASRLLNAWRPASKTRAIRPFDRLRRVRHGLAEMIRYRVLLIAAGDPDGNDCDALKSDPAFKMAVGRRPESGNDLCSQPTISRLETDRARPPSNA
jgi:hypothetical protein